jgi:hypothetical protein
MAGCTVIDHSVLETWGGLNHRQLNLAKFFEIGHWRQFRVACRRSIWFPANRKLSYDDFFTITRK